LLPELNHEVKNRSELFGLRRHNLDWGGAWMNKEIAWDVDEMEQEAPMRRAEAHVNKIVRKFVYSLPSGRKMTVILDGEAEPTPAMAYSQ